MVGEAARTISNIDLGADIEGRTFLQYCYGVESYHRVHHGIVGDQPHDGRQLSVFYQQAYLEIP